MKKIKYLLFVILTFVMMIPLCFAEGSIEITSAEMIEKTGEAVQTSDPKFDGLNITFNAEFKYKGDSIKYKLVLNNTDDKDYEFTMSNSKVDTDFIEYLVTSDNDSNIVKKNTSSTFYVTVLYKKEVSIAAFDSETYKITEPTKIILTKESNPNTITGVTLFIVFGISGILAVALIKFKKQKFITPAIIILALGSFKIVSGLDQIVISITPNIDIQKRDILDKKKFWEFVNKVKPKEIKFVDAGKDAGDDVSAAQNNSILIWEDNGVVYVSERIAGHDVLAPIDSSYLFAGYDYDEYEWTAFSYVTSIDVTYLNTSNVTTMYAMFDSDYYLESLDLSNFDTSNVTDMGVMFNDCAYLETLNVSSFDTSKVKSMGSMFAEDYSLTSLDVSNFNTSNVTEMDGMFYNCESLAKLDLSNFNTGKVDLMGSMFSGCSKLTSLDLSNFDTSKVEDIHAMFQNCTNLKDLDISSFDTSTVKDMADLFYGCENLTNLDLSHFNTSNVLLMNNMFYDCAKLEELNISGWNTAKVEDMSFMFADCVKLAEIDVSSFDTSKVENMESMFQNCYIITKLDLSNFKTSNVRDMGWMFYGCEDLENLNIGSFDTSNVTDLTSFLYDCKSLSSIKVNVNNAYSGYIYGKDSSVYYKIESTGRTISY